MPFENLIEHSRQAREQTKQFQEQTFRHRHTMAKRDSQSTPPPRLELGPEDELAFQI